MRCGPQLACLLAGFLAVGQGRPASAGTYSITEPDTARGHEAPRDPLLARTANTFGLLQGASALGFDHESLISDRLGFQIGAGLMGFDAGITWHFSPGIRTNHLYLGYWHFGLGGESLLGGAAGLTYVMRTPGLITMQLGMGVVVVDGRAANQFEPGSLALLCSMGLCPRAR